MIIIAFILDEDDYINWLVYDHCKDTLGKMNDIIDYSVGGNSEDDGDSSGGDSPDIPDVISDPGMEPEDDGDNGAPPGPEDPEEPEIYDFDPEGRGLRATANTIRLSKIKIDPYITRDDVDDGDKIETDHTYSMAQHQLTCYDKAISTRAVWDSVNNINNSYDWPLPVHEDLPDAYREVKFLWPSRSTTYYEHNVRIQVAL